MEISHLDMYWLTRLDGILVCAGILIGVFGVGLFIYLIVAAMIYDTSSHRDEDKKFPKWFKLKYVKYMIAALVFNICVVLFVPNVKEAAVIYIAPKVINNKEVQKLPMNVLKLANQIEEMLDLKPKGQNNDDQIK